METNELIIALLTANKNIANAKKQLEEAVESKDWSRAAEIDMQILGMRETVLIFEQAAQVMESAQEKSFIDLLHEDLRKGEKRKIVPSKHPF